MFLLLLYIFSFVGVCCPDDILSSGVVGSQVVIDLPAGGYDYEGNENNTGKKTIKAMKENVR